MATLLIVEIILLVVFVILAIAASIRVVSQEERLVIYRLGRFHRMAGPGLVLVLPGLDRVVRTLHVRDQPLEISVDGLFAYGVPSEMTFNLWCSFDLVQAAGGDWDKLARLVQIRDGERHHQVEVKMREALVNQISDLQKRMPLPPTATTMDGVIALAPGSPRYRELLEGVKRELEQTLPSVGVILNPAHSIVLTGRNISNEIVEALKRRRGREIDSEWLMNYVDSLRQRFPGVSNAVLAQMLASIEGVDVGKVQRLLLEHDADTESEVEFEMTRDGEGPNVITRPRAKKQDTAAERQPARPEVDRFPIGEPLPEGSTLTADKHTNIEAYAVAKIDGLQENTPLVLDRVYKLLTGILSYAPDGFIHKPVELPRVDVVEVDIVVRAGDMDILPHWRQSVKFYQGRDSGLIEFKLIPKKVTSKQVIEVEFYYQRHWLAQIKFEVAVVEAVARVPA